MPFLGYLAIILVSLGGILFELNWLTSPKLENKPAVQASVAAPPKVAEAIMPRSEIAPPRNVAPTVTMVPAASSAAPAPAPVAAAPVPAPQPVETSSQQAGTAPAISPAPFGAATGGATSLASTETTGVAPQEFKREFTTDTKADTTVSSATVTSAVAVSANNKCDVAACSAAYQSFRASDCTFQPMDGARKACDRAPEAAQRAAPPPRDTRVEAAARKPNKDTELRAVEREVRRMTAREAGIDPGNNPGMGRSEVIMIGRRDW